MGAPHRNLIVAGVAAAMVAGTLFGQSGAGHDHRAHDHAAPELAGVEAAGTVGAAPSAPPAAAAGADRASGASGGDRVGRGPGGDRGRPENPPADSGHDPAELELVPTGLAEERERADVPEDRYAMAGGCYVLRSVDTGAYVTPAADGFAATAAATDAEPFHFQAYDLGKYLLFDAGEGFVAVGQGPMEQLDAALDTLEGHSPVRGDTELPRSVHGDLPAADPLAEAALPDTLTDTVVRAQEPSPAAEWVVTRDDDGTFGFRLPVPDGAEDDPGPLDPPIAGTLAVGDGGALTLVGPDVADATTRFALELVDGCADWPEIEINVDGPVVGGTTPYQETRGYLDGHLHMMAFEFLGGRARCGRPWHPYGVAYALVDCPDHEPGGVGAVLETALTSSSAGGHDTVGWPTFGYWPKYDSLTHEQLYYRWIERAWRGGVRMITALLVDNNVLCEIYPFKENSCNEMDGVRLQAQRLREFERYIDAQSGGPGEGWLRIVTDPFEAREVVNSGKLAIVMGIEVSALFDCVEYQGVPQCDIEQIDDYLAEVHDLGVRQMELVNKFDNALSGVAGDGGTTGVLVNTGNRYETGHYWRMQTCDEPEGHQTHAHDKTQYNVADGEGGFAPPAELTGRDALAGGILQLTGGLGAAPVYPEGPHCNTAGLAPLGEYLVRRMAEYGMLFDPDHMSARGRNAAMNLIESMDYSGVISSHGWADDGVYERVLQAGGIVTPYPRSTPHLYEEWTKHRSWIDGEFTYGLGYGADTNGFGAQAGPRDPAEGDGVTYPFTGFGGVTIDRQVSGQQTYDINIDGVDHYGLYPDFIEDLRVVAGEDADAISADLQRGPEAFLQTWERALGIDNDACRTPETLRTVDEFRRLQRGMAPAEVLRAVGQPHERVGTTFRYCGLDRRNRATPVVLEFDDAGGLSRVR